VHGCPYVDAATGSQRRAFLLFALAHASDWPGAGPVSVNVSSESARPGLHCYGEARLLPIMKTRYSTRNTIISLNSFWAWAASGRPWPAPIHPTSQPDAAVPPAEVVAAGLGALCSPGRPHRTGGRHPRARTQQQPPHRRFCPRGVLQPSVHSSCDERHPTLRPGHPLDWWRRPPRCRPRFGPATSSWQQALTARAPTQHVAADPHHHDARSKAGRLPNPTRAAQNGTSARLTLPEPELARARKSRVRWRARATCLCGLQPVAAGSHHRQTGRMAPG
jgi:hypothetical protein